MRETYGVLLPNMDLSNLAGRLIVIEGTDGVGRTTQIDLLRPWLEQEGHAVLVTGMSRSSLAGRGIKRAKEGNTLGRVTSTLFYATDFADRLEHEIIPALRAGFIVLTDRYIYSLMARARVRGMDAAWLRNLYSFALKPDAIFYLRIGVAELIPRVVFSRGFDYWESGMDLYPSEDMYEGFCKYQDTLIARFDDLAKEYGFQVVDGTKRIDAVFSRLRSGIQQVLKDGGLAAGSPAGPQRRPPERQEEPAPAPAAESPAAAAQRTVTGGTKHVVQAASEEAERN
jgi:dTMP kinase